MRFQDRNDGGRQLAALLHAYANRLDVLVLGLPRGGVPVALTVAKHLRIPMDIWMVRKLGTPGEEELAMGAIASGGVRVLNEEVVNMLRIPTSAIETAQATQQQELERREHLYRGERPLPHLKGRVVIIVDDGIATGSTTRAAITAVRKHQPGRIVVAAPVIAAETAEMLRHDVDEVVCVLEPATFWGVGYWYDEFPQTTDEEVQRLLAIAWGVERSDQRPESETRP